MSPSHFVTYTELALHSNIHFHHLDHTGGEFITAPELRDLFIAHGLQYTNLFSRCAFDIVHACAHSSSLCHGQVKKSLAGQVGQNLLGEELALLHGNRTGTIYLDIRHGTLSNE